ncbi:MAG: hypothetical protein J3R72DRAFT_454166 [Linnemannia gamsii]|nr:MAG: hypothetical protein J3R72DRAFT_454166 [Linnemannia gamsii]
MMAGVIRRDKCENKLFLVVCLALLVLTRSLVSFVESARQEKGKGEGSKGRDNTGPRRHLHWNTEGKEGKGCL